MNKEICKEEEKERKKGGKKDKKNEQPPPNQDERLLDLLEHAPTFQEHNAKRAAGRGRATMEDK